MIRAVGNNILIKMPQEETVTPGGVVLPSIQDGLQLVEVITVGEGLDCTPNCKEGDKILVSYINHSSTIRQGDDKMCFITFYDVLGIEE